MTLKIMHIYSHIHDMMILYFSDSKNKVEFQDILDVLCKKKYVRHAAVLLFNNFAFEYRVPVSK